MSAGRTFLLEVGCEEIPAAMVLPALTDLSARLLAAVGGDGAAGGLGGRSETPPPFGGPRRLVAVIAGLRDREEDRLVTVTGPPVAVAFDAAGQPTKAALGFAKAQGVDPGALRRVAGEKGEVVGLEKKIHGRAAVDVLSAACPKVLSEMRFPKMMKWGDKGHMFVRPVHWIVALLDGEIVPFEFLGVPSGRATTGHRFLSPGPLDIPSAQEYEQVLATRGKVLARNTARRERIVAERSAAAASMGWSAREDEALLAELTFLNEYPSVIAGTFAEEFLSLEEPFIVTPMRHHQKYFPASRPDGSLAPGFLAVINTEAGRSEAIRRGNEWVLRARLADARFFREEDRKRRLSDRLPDLARIAFHERLGDTLQRSQRLERLARWLSAALDLPGDLAEVAAAAARLSKADLATGMVGEFPELQGIVGSLYVESDGIPRADQVARAIALQYAQAPPRSAHPEIPGMVLALADKLDLLGGSFAVGLIPKGSADPYGLRRAALGVLRILSDPIGLPRALSLTKAFEQVIALYAEQGIIKGADSGAAPLVLDFLEQRLKFLMEESGIRYDTARAIAAAGWSEHVHAAWLRAQALDLIRAEEQAGDFDALAASAKRIGNILAQAREKGLSGEGAAVDPARLVDPEEKDLHAAMAAAGREVTERSGRHEYREAFSAVAALRPRVDRFFDKVLVMAPDVAVRSNRLALLGALAAILRGVADFSEIVVEKNAPEAAA